MLSSQEKSEPTPNIDVRDNSGIKVPFPQTCKELSLVQIRGFPNTEVMFYVFFFSLENFFWFSKMQSVEQISDVSLWANNMNTQATDISK